MKFNSSYVKRLLFFTAVPAVAIIIALRQGYLNVFHHLSTWKGGGMGMFAGADHASNRFLRVYIELPDGTRQPVINFTSAQDYLIERALWYPSDSIFEDLARSLRRTRLVAADQQVAVYKRDSAGKRAAPSEKSYYQVNAVGPPKSRGCDLDLGMAVIHERTIYFGGDALNILSLLSARDGYVNNTLARLFREKAFAARAYPYLRAGRAFVLRALGRKPIGAHQPRDGRLPKSSDKPG